MDISIRCLACGSSYAEGGLEKLPTEDEALQKAVHNPGCLIIRPNHRTVVHTETVSQTRVVDIEGNKTEIVEEVTAYTILVFPAYSF